MSEQNRIERHDPQIIHDFRLLSRSRYWKHIHAKLRKQIHSFLADDPGRDPVADDKPQ